MKLLECTCISNLLSGGTKIRLQLIQLLRIRLGGASFCDILYVEDLDVFNERYLKWADFGKSAKGH